MANSADHQFTLLTWNVHMGLHNDGGRNDVAGAVASLTPDVVVLQEAWWYGATESDLVAHVAEAVGGVAHSYTSPTPLEKYPASWTIAIITRRPARRLDDLVVPSHPGLERRAVRVRLDTGHTIAGMHLDGVHTARHLALFRRQRAAFRAHAAQLDVIAGDLNQWATFVNRDARPLRPAVSGRTWPSHRPHSQIDHVLISDRLDVASAEVVADMGSDHRALRCTLHPIPVS